jgi:uncharacterized membrane protein
VLVAFFPFVQQEQWMRIKIGERQFLRFFRLALWVKAFDASVELLAGFGAFFVSSSELLAFTSWVSKGELIEDPHDIIANALLHIAGGLPAGKQIFAGIYLLAHGSVKLWLVAGLLRRRLWYYPVAMVVFSMFIVYQTYKWSISHSAWLLALTMLDLVVVALTWREYRIVRQDRAR